MYRIIFDPKASRFIVQILVWACLWRSCINQISQEPMHFETLAEARAWVNALGISELYTEQLPLAMFK